MDLLSLPDWLIIDILDFYGMFRFGIKFLERTLLAHVVWDG